jgi:hypothetical protein
VNRATTRCDGPFEIIRHALRLWKDRRLVDAERAKVSANRRTTAWLDEDLAKARGWWNYQPKQLVERSLFGYVDRQYSSFGRDSPRVRSGEDG